MRISLNFIGLDELIKKVESLSDEGEIKKVNKRIYQKCADITEPRMKSHMARSADNRKSGKKGYRPPGHAADNIPKKVSATKGEVGWTLKGDAENWFYMKFVEWGTSKMPPRDFIENTIQESDGEYGRIADQEYQQLLNAKLG